jgi:hypothetical protein
VQQGIGEVVEGTLAAMAPVPFAPRSVVIVPPWIDILALASRTLQGTIFPPKGMNVGLTLVSAEELMDIREYGHG